VVYSTHGKEIFARLKPLFEAANPGTEIHNVYVGSEDIFNRVSTERNNPQGDLWWGAPSSNFMRAEKLGLLEAYKPSWAEHVLDYARSSGDFWYGTFSTPEVFAFNNHKLTQEEAPRDWNDIIGPEWKDKIVLRNPVPSGTMKAIFCGMLEQSLKRTGKEDEGWAWLKALDANVSEYAITPEQMHAKLGNNPDAITLWNMPDIAFQKAKANMPFGYVFPAGGTVVLTDAIAVIKGTRKRELAERFYEFVTSKESVILLAEEFYRIPSRTDISRDELPQWLREVNFTALDIDWEFVADREMQWMKKWDAEIKSK